MIWTFISYARSGGTLLNRCLGAMPQIVTLSEVGPFGGGGGAPGNTYSTVWDQALYWFDTQLRSREYLPALLELEEVCRRRGKCLVVREWTYANFNRHPGVPPYEPPMTLWTIEQLRHAGHDVRPFGVVRDAVDVWLSMGAPPPGPFFERYRAFIEALRATGCPILRFEDFTRDPEARLAELCARVELPFSTAYRDFPLYLDVNGDVASNKSGAVRMKRGEDEAIVPASARLLAPHHNAALAGNADLLAVQEAFNYRLPEAKYSWCGSLQYSIESHVGRRLRRAVRDNRRRASGVVRHGQALLKTSRSMRKRATAGSLFTSIEAPGHLGMTSCRVSTADLFKRANTAEGSAFPPEIEIVHDPLPETEVDVDIVIGAFRQPDLVNEVVRNYLGLERALRPHVYVVETSGDPEAVMEITPRPQLTRVYLNQRLESLERTHEPHLFASNGAALSGQLGFHLGRARWAFFSHTDMMGYAKNFLSDLMGHTGPDVPLASYHVRGVLPFSAGALYDKRFFVNTQADWLPLRRTVYDLPELRALAERLEMLRWVDCGEQFPLEVMAQKRKAYCALSRGGSTAYFVDRRILHGLDYENYQALPIIYGTDALSRTEYVRRYPELVDAGAGWAKCFDGRGNVTFIHSGRGISKKGGRGQFFDFLKAFNDERGL